MANQQLNIKLGFTAETNEAKRAIEDLGKSLRKIQVQPQSVFDDRALRKASQAAQDLEKHLFNATNVHTGKLDLNKFSQSLTNADQDLRNLCTNLRLAGDDGEKAFLNLVKNINKADSSTLNLGSKLEVMLKTLKNTARWELSSNIVHGFESAISNAYGYAQDLNKSLNDIRIVTGRNIDQMSQFAEAANKAARALSTTTTDYTNASLIYFQQGLSNKEVEERTNVTIKMANAAGVSAQVVSDQMTAVWNNFDNGTKSLEYYADVMTALGAATASSTDEISEGLNKFAAIAETVGLSYEYATAALATVTSETRESADVVGNAYKTLFARIQGLQQGDTLDDGTTLNKYSAALGKVGIDIKDVNGDMKEMDTILDEMGAKWVTLSKDQQLALAQTVAGVRQYNQLVALMDNWQVFQKNLTTAYGAEGALEEQAEIYAESWEAASKRVEAAAQGIYKTLLDDEFFIGVTNTFGSFLAGVEDVVQGVGGLKTILLLVGSIFLKQYTKEIPDALTNLKNNFDIITGKAEKNKIKVLKTTAERMGEIDPQKIQDKSIQSEVIAQQKIAEMNYQLAISKNSMSKAQIEFWESQIKNIDAYKDEAVAISEEIKALKKLSAAKKESAKADADSDTGYARGKRFISNQIEKEKNRLEPLRQAEDAERVARLKVNQGLETISVERDEIQGYKDLLEKKRLKESRLRQLREGLLNKGLTEKQLPTKLPDDFSSFQAKGISQEQIEEYLRAKKEAASVRGEVTKTKNLLEKSVNRPISKDSTQGLEEIIKVKLADLADIEAAQAEREEELRQAQEELTSVKKTVSKDEVSRNVARWENLKKRNWTDDDRSKAYDKWHKEMTKSAKLENISQKIKDQTFAWDRDIGLEGNTLEKQKGKMTSFLQTLQKDGILSEAELANYTQKVNDFSGSIWGLNLEFRKFTEEVDSPFERLEEDIKNSNAEVEKLNTTLRAMGYDHVELSTETERVAQIDNYEARNDGVINRIKDQSTNIEWDPMEMSEMMGTMATKAIELYGAISALQSIRDIWNDASLAPGEKLLQLFSAMIPVALMLGEAFNKNSREQLANVGTTLLYKAGLVTTTGATTGATVATWSYSGALQALNASFGAIGVAIGVFAAALAAIVLVGWGVVAIFQAIKNNTPEEQLKVAKERAKELNGVLEEATNSANELKDAFDQYDSAQQALEECTKNTQEWNEALTDVNNQVLSLLQAYPELAAMTNETGEKAIGYGKNGQLEIADWAREKIIDQANQNVLNTQIAASFGKRDVREGEIAVSKSDTKAALDRITTDFKATVSDGKGGTGQAQVNDYIVNNADRLSSMSPEDLKEDLINFFDQEGVLTMGYVNDWVDATISLGGEISELGTLIETNNAVTKTENELLARQILAQDESIANSENFDAAAKITGASLESKIDAELAKMDSWGKKDINKATGVNAEAREIFEEYAKAAGITNYDLTDTTGTDKNRNFVYTDSSGQEVTASLENMKRVVAASRVSAEVAENAQGFVAALSNKTTAEVAAMTAAITQNVEELTAGQAAGNFDIESAANNLTESDLNAMGYTGDLETMRAEYIENYNTIAAAAAEALADIIDDFGVSVEGVLNGWKDSGVLNELTLGQVEALGTQMTAVVNEGGQSALDTFSSIFASMGAEDQMDFISAFSGLDWSTATLDSFKTTLEAAGIATGQFADEDLRALVDTMREASVSAQVSTEKFATLNEFAKGLESGDTISAEDYDKFDLYGMEMDQYFTKMADGTYKLIGDAEEFYNTVRAASLKDFKSSVNKDLTAFENASKVATTDISAMKGYQYDADAQQYNYSTDASTQLDFLEMTGYTETAAIENWKQALEQGTLDQYELTQAVAQHIETMGGEEAATAKVTEALAAKGDALQASVEQYLSFATTLNELEQFTAELNADTGLDIGGQTQVYQEALIGLAQQYENCTAQLNAYKEALSSGNEEIIEAAQNTLELSIRAGELASKYDLDADALEIQAKYLKQSAANAELSEKQLIELAAANQRMNKGIATLNKNWSDWSKTLKKADKTSMDYAQTVADMTDALVEITGALDDSMIPFDFFDESTEAGAEHLEWMSRAAKGDVQAINLLGNAVGEMTVKSMEFNEMISNTALNEGLFDTTGFDGALDAFEHYRGVVLDGITSLQEAIRNGSLEAGQDVADILDSTGESWVGSLNQMAIATGMSVEEMNSLLNQLGVQAEVTTTDVPQKMKVPMYEERVEPMTVNSSYTDDDGNIRNTSRTAWVHYTVPMGSKEVDGVVQVAQIKAEGNDSVGNKAKVTWTGTSGSSGGGGVSPSSTAGKKGGGGGSKSKPKKAKEVKKSDVVERYKEIDDKLDDVAESMDDASKAADRLWGDARIKQMQRANNLLKKEIDLTRQKKQEAENYLAIDKKALQAAAKEGGVSFKFDANGNISNYTEQMTKLYNQLNSAIQSANKDGNATDAEQEKIDKIQEKIDKIKEAISQYDETKELIEDLENEELEKLYQWQDANYDMLNYELEIKISIEESDLELVEYYLNKVQDNIYKTAEAFGYMNDMTDNYTNQLAAQQAYAKQLEKDYYAGRISMDAYKEGLREAQSATVANLEALMEQKIQMQDYYGNVMDMALEEIALYVDEMEELNSVLDHYSNILELVGKQEDYASKKKVLSARAANLRNEMQVQQNLYEESMAQAEQWYEKMNAATAGSNEYETYKKNWIAAQEAANEAQDAMLSKTEEWAETMKAIVEAELSELAKIMEESLTGGTSFDELLTSMERRSSLQEEYLTTTNQIYETNKLMRQAQQEIDKTTNSVAKKRLQGFINETEQLQNQSELSEYELEIQKAKYDLLLAEIALEEAQNAKSTVRLTRDSEGNFGYVYTADQGAVDKAAQELEDKQNNLYNIGLRGANEYSQKYAETMQEAQDAITELTQMWINHEIETEEEFNRRKAEIQEYYYGKLMQYSELYQIALTTDSNVIKDAWTTDFNDMMYKTEEWQVAVDDYFAQAAESMQTWSDVCATVLEESGLDDLSDKVEEISDKSQSLRDILIGEDGESGVVGAMMSEVEAAAQLSEAYVAIQNEIDNTIKLYEEFMEKLNEDYTNPSTPVVPPEGETPKEETPKENNNQNNENNDNNNNTTTRPSLKKGSKITVKNGTRWYSDSWGGGTSGKAKSGTIKYINSGGTHPYNIDGLGWIRKSDIVGYDTGGYTGDWGGAYGKLAFLHKKELILKEGDTENFLASMELLDKIVSAIDLYSMNAQLGGALSSPGIGNFGRNAEAIEQQVHIEASFPAVQDRNEIEEAFNTLINRASQYANRK